VTTRLTLTDIADVVAGQLKAQRKDLLAHLERRVALEQTLANNPREDIRYKNLHARLTRVESELRLLNRGRR
jgi:hypothetical protein